MTLTLTITGMPLSSNDRVHYRERARQIAAARAAAKILATAEWGRRPPKLTGPAEVIVQDQCRTANLRDTGNCQPAVKAAIAGLTDYGRWPDDDATHVARIVFLPPMKTGADALVLTITTCPQAVTPTQVTTR